MKIPFGNIKRGYRTIGGETIYFRSRVEANYCRYLQFLKEQGEIKKWDYELCEFEFKKIKRGVRFYKPDFRILENNGKIQFIECKGWKHPKGEIALRRMAKYYPNISIGVINTKAYKKLARQVSNFIKDWEK